MTTTDGVLVLPEVGCKGLRVPFLYQPHALLVQPLDIFGDSGAIGRVIGLIGETTAPVAEVGADDEEVGGVGEVGREEAVK